MAVAMRPPIWISLSRCSAAVPSAASAAAAVTPKRNRSFSNTKLSAPSQLLYLQGANYVEFGFCRFSSGSSRLDSAELGARASVKADVAEPLGGNGVRVRFAPSPTGNLHVGGARTALFNYLFAKSTGGRFILRVEDTDLERSTRQSEEAVLRDLKWLGLDWDEGPDIGGEYGPYRQSERNEIYQQYVEKLLKSGNVYRCFCTDEELEAMREECKAKNLPPKYMGKWGSASEAEIEAELAKGTPYTYRFRVAQEGSVTINDLIRGEVSWNQDTLGDFVVLRSNGQPVYNFCVTVDDVTMKITHVIRAEEHLPNTLRQALIYKALGFSMPQFGHVSLILAPDRSKLSKRHGATSVGQFKEMGYLPAAMVNYLSLLGWNDGSEEEVFTVQQLIEKFTIDRITKSAAIFDLVKLGWMNGQHLRALPVEIVGKMFGEQWLRAGLVSQSEGPFIDGAVGLLQNGTDIVPDSEEALRQLLAYPLHSTLESQQVKEFVDDNLREVAELVLAAYDSGDLQIAIDGGHDTWKKWINSVGKALKRKGKRLFMPMRILLTGRMQGPDIGSTLALLTEGQSSGLVTAEAGLVQLEQRIETLRAVDWSGISQVLSKDAEGATVLAH